MCGDVRVVPAIYNPALQHCPVIWGEIAEELAKPIRWGTHQDDLLSDVTIASLIEVVCKAGAACEVRVVPVAVH
jgi:hypothetical protein